MGQQWLLNGSKKTSDKKVYQEVSNSENILSKLAEMSNKIFSNLKKKDYITDKQLKYFSYEYGKDTNFVNFISFPKLIKGGTMSQFGQLFRIAVHLQVNAWIF